MRFFTAAAAFLLIVNLAPAQLFRRRVPPAECCPPVPLTQPPVPLLPPPSVVPSPTRPGEEAPRQPGEETPTRPGQTTPPPSMDPSLTAQPPSSSAFSEALASAGEGGTQSGASYMPGFFGDLLGGCSMVLAEFPVDGSPGIFDLDSVCIPDIATASGLKIAESDSPRPLDRFYYLYNFYGNIDVATPNRPALQLHRHILGFEKTFLGGDASIGLRVPFLKLAGSLTYDTALPGDLSVITKFALINNPANGNVVSGGLVVTAPTGGDLLLMGAGGQRFAIPERTRAAYIQPYAGYIYNPSSRLYIHGFHSVAIPTDSALPLFMANDIGAGLWLYRNPADGIIQAILPTIEIHVNTPFTNRDDPTLIGQFQMRDSVNLTMGTYIMFPRSVFGGGVSVPLAFGPHTIEALASYTLRF